MQGNKSQDLRPQESRCKTIRIKKQDYKNQDIYYSDSVIAFPISLFLHLDSYSLDSVLTQSIKRNYPNYIDWVRKVYYQGQ